MNVALFLSFDTMGILSEVVAVRDLAGALLMFTGTAGLIALEIAGWNPTSTFLTVFILCACVGEVLTGYWMITKPK